MSKHDSFVKCSEIQDAFIKFLNTKDISLISKYTKDDLKDAIIYFSDYEKEQFFPAIKRRLEDLKDLDAENYRNQQKIDDNISKNEDRIFYCWTTFVITIITGVLVTLFALWVTH